MNNLIKPSGLMAHFSREITALSSSLQAVDVERCSHMINSYLPHAKHSSCHRVSDRGIPIQLTQRQKLMVNTYHQVDIIWMAKA